MSDFEFGGELLRKAGDEQVLTAVVYPVGRQKDYQGDYCDDPEELRAAAYSFLSTNAPVWLEHRHPLSKEQAHVVESFLAPSDLEISGRSISKGTWLVSISVPSPAIWKMVREGAVSGISLSGRAERDATGNLRKLDVREISLVSKPAQPASRILAMKSEGNVMTAEQREKILKLIDSIEQRLELAKREYMAKKHGLEGLMADPNAASEFLKNDLSESELSERLAAFCEKFERVMRAEFQNSSAPVSHATRGCDDVDQSGLGRELRDATEGNKRVVDDDNRDLYRKWAQNRTEPR